MSGMMSDYLAKALLDHVTGVASYTPPTQIKLGLFTSRGTVAQSCAGTNFVAVSGGSYDEVDIGVGTTNWNTAALSAPNRLTDNKLAKAFATATASWGTVYGYTAKDQSGNLLWWGDLASPQAVPDGATASFAGGVLDVNLPQGS